LITPAGVARGVTGAVWAAVEAAGLRVTNARMVALATADAAVVSTECGAPLTAGDAVALEVGGEGGSAALAGVMVSLAASGSTARGDVVVAPLAADAKMRNAFFGPKDGRLHSALDATSVGAECAVVLVLPTAVTKRQGGAVLAELYAGLAGGAGGAAASAAGGGRSGGGGGGGLRVTALGMYDIDRRCAEEFLEVYRHVLPDFPDYAAELSSGSVIAVEVTGPDAVTRMRALAGPRDVDVAKRIRYVVFVGWGVCCQCRRMVHPVPTPQLLRRPDTLRAKFGVSSAQPAVHCTDLVADGPLESEYIFSLLPQP